MNGNVTIKQASICYAKVCAVVCTAMLFTGYVHAQKVIPAYDIGEANNVQLVVRPYEKTMRDGVSVPFWVYCKGSTGGGGPGGGGPGGGGPGGGMACANSSLPGPTLELTANEAGKVTLQGMMAPQEMPEKIPQNPDAGQMTTALEANAYLGHTIHLHGLDVETQHDGVPETFAAENGGSSAALRLRHTYEVNANGGIEVDNRYIGSHMYHCHVHTVKHLEMGMYGALIVRGTGDLANRVNAKGPRFDYEWNMMLSTVDPAYHQSAAKGDSAIFADYKPTYFLINGEQGYDAANPNDPNLRFSANLTSDQQKRLVIRLMGIHSTNATFRILYKDDKGIEFEKPFTIYNMDGFALQSPKTVTSAELSPGQTKDIMVTLDQAGVFYPRVEFRDLRKNAVYQNGVVVTELTVNQN